jgi:hypothetical protein
MRKARGAQGQPVRAEKAAYETFYASGFQGQRIVVCAARAAGPKAQPLLDRLKAWLTQNNAVVTGAVLIVIGAVLLEEGVRALA